ncbi:hypothetical protein V8D89_008671 [Ganoderma adspersum]
MSATHSHLDNPHNPNTLHRFQQHPSAPYYLSHPQPGLEPLSTALPHSSFSSRQQPWMLNVQTNYNTHQQNGAGGLSPERTQAAAHPNTFYSGAGPESQLVGYPESSQRTALLQDAAAYATLYNVSFPYTPAQPTYAHPHSPPAATPVEELQSALDSHTLARGSGTYRGVPPMAPAERRASFGGPGFAGPAGQFLDGARADMYGPGTPTRYVSAAPAPTAAASYPPPSFAGLASPTSPYAHSHSHSHMGGELMDMHSPRPAPYAIPMRRDSMDSVSVPDPISPSSVPGLVFDADDYDDDSESSLPSAASEVHRLPYRTQATEEREFELASREWSRSSVSDGSGSGSSTAVGFEDAQGRSPDTSMDGEREREQLGSTGRSTPPEAGHHHHERTRPTQKKSKMHQCTVCFKLFPRPSGLATHMNSHSGAKPFKCPIPTCTKSFAVRSNAKRHLRTHGIFPTSDHPSTSPSQFTVGFDTPLVSEVHEAGKLPSKLRWVPPSLSTRTNVDFLRSPGAGDPTSDSEDEFFQPSCPLLPLPLPAVTPSSPTWNPEDQYEERNSYQQVESAPYISSQWRSLPGPAIASPTGF